MKFAWKPGYRALASRFLKLHFGGFQGVTSCFPCMRETYPWGNHRPQVLDSRVPAKNSTEYHGLERHAMQYHATGQYEYSYHHWLLAACWRKEDMTVNNFRDSGHIRAIEYDLSHAMYNKALHAWQHGKGRYRFPTPGEFGLDSADVERKEVKASEEIANFHALSASSYRSQSAATSS
jgi:hypothetical protein